MIDTKQSSDERHNLFIKRVTQYRTVWGLQSGAGWCVSPSNEDSDIKVMPFWSDRTYAARCARDEWAHYEPTSIPLDEFLETWLPGMANDGLLVGTNWNGHLIGKESDPAKLREELLIFLNDIS